jgi:hypothetical protein
MATDIAFARRQGDPHMPEIERQGKEIEPQPLAPVVEDRREGQVVKESDTPARDRGPAAPEHDVASSPAVAPAGAHHWPLPAGGMPIVTGEPHLTERGVAGQPEWPSAEWDLPGEPDRVP